MEKKAEQLRLLQSMMGGGDDKLEQKVDQVLALVLRIGEEQVAIKERLSRVELSCNNQVAGVDGIEDKITMIQDAVLVFNGKVGELQNCITSVGKSASAAKRSADGAKSSADGAQQIATAIQNNQKYTFGWYCSEHGWQSAQQCVSNLRNSRLCTTKN